jgi:site-specific DNA recombinase
MTHMDPPVRAVIYARISKDQNGEAAGVGRQIESCTLLATAREWQLVSPPLVDNDISAYSGVRRPAYEQLMEMIRRRQIDAVLTMHMDRMCRRIADLVEIAKLCRDSHVKIASVHGDFDLSSPMGQMFVTILVAVAEYEMAHKGERQVHANMQSAKAGKRRMATPRPFGYEDDHTTKRPAEADAIEWAAGELLAGSTISSVMRKWQALGLSPAQNHGRPWTRNSVTTIMRNPAIAGLSAYRGEILHDDEGEPVEGKWDAILPVDVWQAVRALLGDPGRKHPRGVRTLLGGLAVCRCGNVIQGSRSYQSNAIYRCAPAFKGTRAGPHAAVRVGPVDEYVSQVILVRLSQPDISDLISPPPQVDAGALRNEAAAIHRNLDKMFADAALAGYSRSSLAAATKSGHGRLREIAEALTESGESAVLAPFIDGENARQVWEALDLARQRAVIATLATVTLHPAGRGARSFDPATVRVEPR